MNRLINVSEASSLALHGLAYIAQNEPNLVRVKDLAEKLNASEAHLAKVFQMLSKKGLIQATRGPKGGFRLLKNPEEISFLNIYEAVESKVVRNGCPLGREKCLFKKCMFSGRLNQISEELYDIFNGIKLSEFTITKGESK
jgi:Rrf2 family protein